jgi:hypothetical protein
MSTSSSKATEPLDKHAHNPYLVGSGLAEQPIELAGGSEGAASGAELTDDDRETLAHPLR